MVHASLRLPGVPTRPMNPAFVPTLSCRAETEMFSPGVIYTRRIRRGCNSQQRADLLVAENSILYYRFRGGPLARELQSGIDPIEVSIRRSECESMHVRTHASSRLLEGEFRAARLFIRRAFVPFILLRHFSSLPSPVKR
jgi:hypothetical protein